MSEAPLPSTRNHESLASQSHKAIAKWDKFRKRFSSGGANATECKSGIDWCFPVRMG